MPHARRFDHVGITVADLDTVTAFFVGLGLEVEGARMFVEGDFRARLSASPTPAPKSSCCGRPTAVPD
jgi:catechol 2,3-dioxygenase-like lactoylglutathione lyase family enzyme